MKLSEKIKNLFSQKKVRAAPGSAPDSDSQGFAAEKNDFEILGMFTASIEHEMRGPLATARNELTSLKRAYAGDPEIDKYLDRIDRSLSEIGESFSIISIVRMKNDELKSFEASVYLEDLLRRSIDRAKKRRRPDKPGIRFEVNFYKTRIFINEYSRFLEMAVGNILENAAEAVDRTKKPGKIEINVLKTSDDFITIEITDNGCGMPPEMVAEMSKTTVPENGRITGIGLFIARKIVLLHGGEIRFESEADKGTTVSILLPEYSPKARRKETGND
jgi:signal transduction histidine kinase